MSTSTITLHRPKAGQSTSTLRRLHLEISGHSMLVNPATNVMLDDLHKGSEGRAAVVKGRPYEIVAREKLCRQGEKPDGALGIKTDCLFAAIVAAGASVKRDARRCFANAKSSVLGGRMSIDRDFLEFMPESLTKEGTVNGEGWIVDKRRGRIPNNGTAVCIVRPLVPTWAVRFAITYDPKIMPDSKVFEMIEIAGRDIGLGDFRVACKGRYGTFQISAFAMENVKASDTGKVSWDDVQAEYNELIRTVAKSEEPTPEGDDGEDETGEDTENNEEENES